MAPAADSVHSTPDVAVFERGRDVHTFELTSHRPWGRWLVIPLKRLLRRLLHPVLARQAEFNVAAGAGILALRRDACAFRDLLLDLRTELSELRDRLSDNRAQQQHAVEIDAAQKAQLAARLTALEAATAGTVAQRAQQAHPLELPLDRFRGPEEVVRERQAPYVARFAGRADVVDLGCGRGEFLELLREAGIRALGVERDPVLVRRCHARGLDVRQGDALAFLAGSAPASLGGVFAAQLIEHLLPSEYAQLIALAATRLRPGGVIVLETVNPLCFASLSSFWIDPTHQRPVHPAVLRWLAEREGFLDAEIVTAVPAPEELRVPSLVLSGASGNLDAFNDGVARLNATLFGDQAFALVARLPE